MGVADITYLNLVTNAYSRKKKIAGYHLDGNMKMNMVKKLLLRILKRQSSTIPIIHHSNRGLQYCSSNYLKIHNNIQCSMKDIFH